MKKIFPALVVALCVGERVLAQVGFTWATIGNPGNPADPLNSGSVPGIGSVDYTYRIATTEVSISQYATFLNAVAATDTHGLYNTNMGTDPNIAGIVRSGTSGSYTYSVIGSGDRPITYVSWNDAARFINWLYNGQGNAGTEAGVYDMSLTNPTRAAEATYWIPSESEWYKAAYYDPSVSGPASDYWLYPTRSDSTPGNTIGSGANQANYYAGTYSTTQNSSYSSLQNYLTDGGTYSGSASYYGTFDQGGNVWEWNEALIGSNRGLRGGSWNFNDGLRSTYRNSASPTTEVPRYGFRVAAIAVPEPSSMALIFVAGGIIFLVIKRSVKLSGRAGN